MKDRSFGLDLLRALAISLVLACHLNVLGQPDSAWKVAFFHLVGLLGSECFFVLSGFLVGARALRSQFASFQEIRAFWARRWWRTLPPFFVAILLWGWLQQPGWPAFLKRLSFSGTLSPAGADWPPPFMTVTWSLAIEEIFYLALPFAVLALGPWKRSLRSLVTVWLGLFALRLLLLGQHPYNHDLARYWPWVRLDALWAGVLAAGLAQRGLSDAARAKLGALGLAGLLAFAWHWFAVPMRHYSDALYMQAGLPLLSLALAGLVLSASAWRQLGRPDQAWSRWLSRGITGFALITYSVYLSNFDLIHYFRGKGYTPGWIALALVACLGAGVIGYFLVERPSMRARKPA